MSRIQKTKKIQKSASRKCSLCRTSGHTKRVCPSTKQSAIPTKPNHKVSFVFVNAHAKVPTSAHIIDLKNKNEKNVWEHVTAFNETTSERIKRISVNFADLVRNANANAKKKSIHPNIDAFRKALEQTNDSSAIYPIKKTKRVPVTHRISRIIKSVFDFCTKQIVDKGVSFVSWTKKISVQRLVPAAAFLLFALVLPFPALSFYKKISNDTSYIVERSTNAFLSLQSSTVAAFSNNIPQAQFDLNEALNGFSEAQMLIDKEYKALTYVAGMLPVVGKRIESRQDILVAGHHIALGNTYLVKGIDEVTKDSSASNTERLSILKAHIKSALPQYRAALESIASISPSALPAEYQQSFVDFRLLYATFIDDMQDLVSVIDGLELALGSEDFRRYLIMFQNNYEIRATGGFTGSYAVLDIQKGKILNIEVPGGGTYDVQGQLDVYLRPPLPLQLANKRWEFQDVNWFPDFPASARKTSEFYQYARGTSVDGVIAINASVLERLLKVMGPIYNEKHDVLLNAEDALTDLQREVEIDYDKNKNEPKAVLSSLLEQMLEGIREVNPKQLLALVAEAHEALEQKEIQTYFVDDRVQNKFRSFGWTGEIVPTAQNQDYLMVVNSNIGGQKSDARLEQHIEHQAVVQDDGSIIDTVIIKREHQGNEDELFYGNKNINFVRVYVPRGSKLLDAGGFSFPEEESFSVPEYWYKDDPDIAAITETETIHVDTGTQISEESGKTAFANWVVTEPGKSSEIYFSYKLPFSIFDIEQSKIERVPILEKILSENKEPNKKTTSHYSLVVQKQSGAKADLLSQIIYPFGWQPVWRTDEGIRVSSNGGELSADLTEDVNFGLVMEYHKDEE